MHTGPGLQFPQNQKFLGILELIISTEMNYSGAIFEWRIVTRAIRRFSFEFINTEVM
jgi:hypothetical protein